MCRASLHWAMQALLACCSLSHAMSVIVQSQLIVGEKAAQTSQFSANFWQNARSQRKHTVCSDQAYATG